MINYLLNSRQVSVIVKGKSYTISKDDKRYDRVMSLIKDKNEDELNLYLNKTEGINRKMKGLTITDEGVVTYINKDGVEDILSSSLINTLIAMYEQDVESVEPLIKFWEKLKLNPSYRVNRCLFDFIEANNIVINEKGNLIMYKIVGRTDDKEVFVDLYTHKIKQRLGESVPRLERNQVDDNIENLCSYGYHLCSWNYLPHYGSCVNELDAIILCELDPADIVAIPKDYNNSKIRCTTYTLLEEYFYKDGEMKDVLYRGYNNSFDDTNIRDEDEEEYEYDYSYDEDEDDED